MCVIFKDRCWVVHIPFVGMVKFKFLAHFPVDHLANPLSLLLLQTWKLYSESWFFENEKINKLFLLLRVFGLLSSSLLLFPQRFGWYVHRPSSGVCLTREPLRNLKINSRTKTYFVNYWLLLRCYIKRYCLLNSDSCYLFQGLLALSYNSLQY